MQDPPAEEQRRTQMEQLRAAVLTGLRERGWPEPRLREPNGEHLDPWHVWGDDKPSVWMTDCCSSSGYTTADGYESGWTEFDECVDAQRIVEAIDRLRWVIGLSDVGGHAVGFSSHAGQLIQHGWRTVDAWACDPDSGLQHGLKGCVPDGWLWKFGNRVMQFDAKIGGWLEIKPGPTSERWDATTCRDSGTPWIYGRSPGMDALTAEIARHKEKLAHMRNVVSRSMGAHQDAAAGLVPLPAKPQLPEPAPFVPRKFGEHG
ncbi:MAG TPA: hypothetical protein VKS24_24910 [Bradyrhizobium sp.]|nr:hypothetical protein [Bradyrhizobium sp.]